MGLFGFLLRRRSSGGTTPTLGRSRTAIEWLEQRVLFAVQVSTNIFDAPPPSGNTVAGAPTGVYADQAGTTNATFSMPGSSSNRVAVAYYDGAMQRYQQGLHSTGWSYSDNGGQSFAQPSNDPAHPALLPTVSDVTVTTGDDSNQSMAWDNANATLYLAATSWPNRSDINVYASTDGGNTFTAGVDATPNAPTANNTTYDKPWLAADNYLGTADGTGYGALYLAYVQNLQGQNQIVITGLAPGALLNSWPTPQNSGNPPGSILATGLVQSPEVLVEPNHSVDVVFVAEDGIYLAHSDSPLSSSGWTNSPKKLVGFQHTDGFPFDYIPLADKESIVRIPYYPSTAIGKVGNDTYLYAAYMDGNLSGDYNEPDGTHGIYFLQYDLTNPQQLPLTPGRVAQDTSVTDQWMPSLALSPDGSYAFIGFYGGNGVYNSGNGTYDEQYNTFYIAGATNAGGPNWGNPTQITNVDGNGQPTGGSFDQPGGPSTDNLSNDPPSEWNPDYDSASADYQNFHYSFMETGNELVHDTSGNPVTLQAQEDVYLANVPIPYTDTTIPPVPAQVTATRGTLSGGPSLTINWSGSFDGSADAYVEYSATGQGWQSLGGSFTPAANGFMKFSVNTGGIPIPNYSTNTTYYFRVRAQAAAGPGHASSGWSAVYVAPGSNTMVIGGSPGSDTIHITKNAAANEIDYTIVEGGQSIAVPIISGGSLLVLGGGGDDTITFDLSNGNFLAGSNTIDNDTGTLKLDLVGTTSNDTVNIIGGGNAPYQFDGTYINVIAGLIKSLEYEDGGGDATTSETVSVTGMIPVMLNLSSGDSTNAITNSDSAPVYIVPGAGKITLNANAGATVFPASTATNGIRQINFAALNISAGAYVALADSSIAFDDFTNHGNRSVAIIDAGGLSIATGGTLDMGDNDMILKYAPANEAATNTQVFNLLASGITTNLDWSGTGITSSEANYDADFNIGARAVGFMDNNDWGDTSFDGLN